MQLGIAQPTNPLIRNRPHNSALTFKHCNLMSKCQMNGMRDSKRRRHLKTAWPWLNPYSISDSNHLQTKPCKLESWTNINDIMIITWCQEATYDNHTHVFVFDGTFGVDQVQKFKGYFLYKTSDLKMLSAVRLLLRTNYLSPASSINRVLGRNSSNSSDPYTKIAQQPKDVVESLAETLELRAAEEQQTLLRERWVRSESWETSWEKGGSIGILRNILRKGWVDQNPEKYLEKRVGRSESWEISWEKGGSIRILRNILRKGCVRSESWEMSWLVGSSLDHQGSCWYNWQSVGGGDS